MNACMHDYAKEQRKHDVVRYMMMELRVKAPYGKDYGFNLYLYHGFYQVPKVIDPFQMSSGCRTDS